MTDAARVAVIEGVALIVLSVLALTVALVVRWRRRHRPVVEPPALLALRPGAVLVEADGTRLVVTRVARSLDADERTVRLDLVDEATLLARVRRHE